MRIASLLRTMTLGTALCIAGCFTKPSAQNSGTSAEPSVDVASAAEAAGEGQIVLNDACAFAQTLNGPISVREASAEAEVAIQRIVDHTGLPKNFVLLEADIDNAVATVVGQDRVIVYDPDLLNRSDWTALGLIAHEVGHHLSGHTLQTAGAGRMEDELEADGFAGFVLGRMGATASEAQAVMDLISERSVSRTHPPKAERVEAVRAGWGRASGQIDRRSELITPSPIPEDGMDEVVLMDFGGTPKEMVNCGFEVFHGTIIQAEMKEEEGYTPAFEITLDLDGPGRETFFADQEDIFTLSTVARSWFYEIAKEGRRVEAEIATCGTGAFESLYRLRALPSR